MTCRELITFLSEYLEGRLPAAQRTRFDGHLERCPPCQAYLHTFQDTIRLGKAAAADEPDPPIPEELVRAILAARQQRKRS